MVLSAIIAVIRAVSAGKLTGKLVLMPECGPPSSWRRRPECKCWEKAVRRSGDFVRRDIPVIQRYRLDILILLLGDNDIGCDTSAEEIANHLIAIASSSAE